MSTDINVPGRIVVNKRRVIFTLETEERVEATTHKRRLVVVVVRPRRVSVRDELDHHISVCRQDRERCHVSTVQANHRLRQRASVQQSHVVQLACTVAQVVSVQVEITKVKTYSVLSWC